MLEMQPSSLASMMEEVNQLQKIRSGGTDGENESSSLQISTKETKHRRGPNAELAFRFKLSFLSHNGTFVCTDPKSAGIVDFVPGIWSRVILR